MLSPLPSTVNSRGSLVASSLARRAVRQPEASLAWAAATSLMKRRQQMLKPCESAPICSSRWGLRCRKTGGSIGETASDEVSPARPGSRIRAKAWGRIAREPVRSRSRPRARTPEPGTPAYKLFQARRLPPGPSGALRRTRTKEERVGPVTEQNKEAGMRGREVVAPS